MSDAFFTESNNHTDWDWKSWESLHRDRERERKAREQHYRDEDKKLRRLIKERGILEVLQQAGIERLDAGAQLRLARQFLGREPFIYNPATVDRRTKLSKLQRLADDPACTAGEREAALAAIARLSVVGQP